MCFINSKTQEFEISPIWLDLFYTQKTVEDVHAKVRKGSQNMLPDPIEDLQEFHDRHFQDLETI